MQTPDAEVMLPDMEVDPVEAAFVPAEGAEGPGPLWGFVVADQGDHRALLIGGSSQDATGAGAVQMSIWQVDASTGDLAWSEVNTEAGPAPRYCGCAAWDPVRAQALVVGGRGAGRAEYPETWRLNPASGEWTLVETVPSPQAPVGCTLIWSERQGGFYLFGGATPQGVNNETWFFDPERETWARLVVDEAPPARYDASWIHTGDEETFYLFGGMGIVDRRPRFYSDVWRFDVLAERWSPVTIDGNTPPGRRVPWVATSEGGFYAGLGVEGMQLGDALGDLWWFDFETLQWSEMATPEGFTPRGFSQWLPGGPGAVGAVYGGFDLRRVLDDSWRLQVGGE